MENNESPFEKNIREAMNGTRSPEVSEEMHERLMQNLELEFLSRKNIPICLPQS